MLGVGSVSAADDGSVRILALQKHAERLAAHVWCAPSRKITRKLDFVDTDAPAHHLFVLLGPVDPSATLPDILCVIQVS